jgi:hypothetical protein
MINAYMLDPSPIYIYWVDRDREREREKKREEGERESIARKNGKERMENVYNLSLPPEWWVGTS